jgi:hypothetical protein
MTQLRHTMRVAGTAIARWWRPWVLAAITGMAVFGTLHQVLVDWAPVVFIGLPAALVLSIPIVLAYAAINRSTAAAGLGFGLVVFLGLVPHYLLITVGMWGRSFDDGPKGSWSELAIVSAPILSGLLTWFVWRSARATIWIVLGMLLFAFLVSVFQESEPDRRNLGALVSLLPACVIAGWVLARTQPRRPTDATA